MTDRIGIPAYRRHSYGQARVTLVDSVTGRKKDVLLGKFETPESRAAYQCVLEKWGKRGCRLDEPIAPDLTIAEMLVKFWEHVGTYYRNVSDGTPTGEVDNFRFALRELYGELTVTDFGPLKLKTVRQRMIDAGLCRTLVNARTNKIHHAFKWGSRTS